MSLSTLSGLVDPEILNSNGEVDFFKLKFRDYKSLKDGKRKVGIGGGSMVTGC